MLLAKLPITIPETFLWKCAGYVLLTRYLLMSCVLFKRSNICNGLFPFIYQLEYFYIFPNMFLTFKMLEPNKKKPYVKIYHLIFFFCNFLIFFCLGAASWKELLCERSRTALYVSEVSVHYEIKLSKLYYSQGYTFDIMNLYSFSLFKCIQNAFTYSLYFKVGI